MGCILLRRPSYILMDHCVWWAESTTEQQRTLRRRPSSTTEMPVQHHNPLYHWSASLVLWWPCLTITQYRRWCEGDGREKERRRYGTTYLCPAARVKDDICLNGQLGEPLAARFLDLDAHCGSRKTAAQVADALQCGLRNPTLWMSR